MKSLIEQQINDLLFYDRHIRATLYKVNIDITDYAVIIKTLIELQNHIRRKQYEYECQSKKHGKIER
jgi:hypothetical protein